MTLIKQRTTWIDIAKGLAIILIVLGHTLRDGTVRNVVYSFHVVTFFVLSGMTCKTDNISKRLKYDFLRIMVPYYVFGLMSIMIFAILGRFAANQLGKLVNTSAWYNIQGLLYACPMVNPIKFNMPLWFLPCLFGTKMLYYTIYKLCHGKQNLMLLLSIVLCIAGFLYTELGGPGLPFNLALSFKMLIFFTSGRILYLHLSEVKPQYIYIYISLIIAAVLLGITVAVAVLNPNSIDYSRDYFSNIGVFLITSCTGSLGIFFLAIAIGHNKIIEYIGKHTLAILVMHKFPVLLFQTVGPQKGLLLQYDSFACTLLSVAITFISITLCLGVELVIHRICPFLLGDFTRAINRNT